MKHITIPLFQYGELSKSAQAVVIEAFKKSSWYDYSDHERYDYNQSLAIFNAAFDTVKYLGGHSVNDVKNLVIQAVNKAAQIHGRENPYYLEYFDDKFESKITNAEQAIKICDHGLLKGQSADFYLTDTIVKFLKGEDYQNLSIGELIKTAHKNGRTALNKQCRFFETKSHIHQCLMDDCSDWFLEDGSKAPSVLTDQLQAA